MLGGKINSSQIFRSTDYGENWNNVLSGNYLQTNDIEVDPLDPSHFIECSYSTNPYNTFFHESFNHGETWVESDFSSLSGKGYDILLSTTLPGRFLCATENGIYLSDDGENFDQVLGVETLMLEEDVDRPGEMYAACGDNGVYRSNDSGISWEPMADLYGEVISVECVELVAGEWLYAGTKSYGIFRYPLGPLGIENASGVAGVPTVTVLSNPAFVSVTLVVSPVASGEILTVFDISGRMVHSESLFPSEAVQHVVVDGLSPGVYFTGLKNQSSFCRFVFLEY